MSWLDRINTDFTILCGGELSEDKDGTLEIGDGVKAFKPNWINASKHIEYNIAEFVFKRIKGSLVKRGTPKGTQYEMELFFQGADNLDVAKDFETKCGYYNKTTGIAPPIRITHPYYGYLYVQPISITLDNSSANVTRVKMMVIETIKDDGSAFAENDIVSTISTQAAKANASYTRTYAEEVPAPDAFDLQNIRKNLNQSYNKINGMLNGFQADADKYTKYYYDANVLINTAAHDTYALLGRTQRMLGAPAYFADSVVNRINMFEASFILINREVNAILNLRNRPTRTLKRLYENNAGTMIIGMCMSTLNNVTNDYLYKPKILDIINRLIANYNTYINNVILMQTLTGDTIDSYIPKVDDINNLAHLVRQTTGYLLSITANARQERTLRLTKPSNIILLSYDLYGRSDNDTIQTLKANNNIGLNEILLIPEGRDIVYYV